VTKRGKTPSLLTGSSGKPSVAQAKQQRNCKRCSSKIIMGESLFEIPKIGGGFSQKKPFCKLCFNEILEQTQKDLDLLKEELKKVNV